MDLDEKLTTLEDFESLRKNIGFHFTQRENVENILKEGLRPKIGDNASGGLGSSAIEKTYISYGLEGVLRLYNRLLVASYTRPKNIFNTITHKPFIPDSAENKKSEECLSMLEGFELIRQYMEHNVYFVFDAPMTQYEHEISDSDIQEVNATIRGIESSGINIMQRYKELDKRIRVLAEQPEENRDEIVDLVEKRNKLAIQIREITLPIINEKRGRLLNESDQPIMEQVDYNDETLQWKNQEKEPHNTHTRIIERDGQIQGVRITPDMLRLFTIDRQNIGNGLDFLNAMLTKTSPSDRLYIDDSMVHDYNLLFKFQEYARLVEKYKEMGLLDTRPQTQYKINGQKRTVPERLVMDLAHIDRYPGLEQFFEKSTQELGKESLDKQKDSKAKETVAQIMEQDEKSMQPNRSLE